MLPAILVAVLALLLVLALARPLVARAESSPAPAAEEVSEIDAQVAGALAEIEEIEFDRASGHLSEEDFSELAADAKKRAVELIRRRDAADPSASDDA